MKKAIGLWIDHREAVMVSLTEMGEETRRLESGVEKNVHVVGGAPMDRVEDVRDRRFTNQLNKYYTDVITQIREADSIFIFGPGEAKIEFKARLGAEGLGGQLVSIETTDKLTERQIAAKVRQHFAAHET